MFKELNLKKNDDSRVIIIDENINNQIIFERGLNKVNFLYPLSVSSKDLELHFNIIDKAFFKLTILIDGQMLKTETVTRTQIFYLRASVISLQCGSNIVCPININVEFTKPIIKNDPMVKITLREIKSTPFSIIIKINPSNRAYTDIPKVVIQVDEFIIGNVKVSEKERISEFYEVLLPHDDEGVILDSQSSTAGIYINLGGTRPTPKNADFKLLPPGRDSILSLTKQQILDKTKKKVDIPAAGSLQDVNLVIVIWTKENLNIYMQILLIEKINILKLN